ncbi:acyl-CoA dehydrogenase family protein [Halopenitus persicus]|uniref:acyl-CoA dehydrogenase family protein n=1 Tax=Halopenitus persicus TaxID=1048396 RepID=UPI000BBADEDF|nr:acyl-CoA dehydrogenase family protein [Halopenitus persicus]
MVFSLSEEQRAVRQSVRDFAENEIAPVAKEINDKGEFPEEVISKAAEVGFLSASIPAEYGGSEMGYLSDLIISEELCRIDPSIGIAIKSCSSAALLISDHGSERQKEEYLKPTARGDKYSSIAITEPQAGSDVTGIQTTAERDGDEYIINGNKIYITNGSQADYVITFARTGPRKDEKPYDNVSAFIVDTDQEGYTTEPTGLMGLDAEDNCTVYLDDVRTEAWQRIGEEGEAFKDLMNWFNMNRVRNVAGYGVGLAQGAFDQAFEYAEEREQFDRSINEFQGIRWKFVDMAKEIESARLLAYRTAHLLDEGEEGVIPPELSALTKLKVAETAREVANEALQIHGGAGYTTEYDIERFYRDAKILEIFEGTNEIMKNIASKEMIKNGGFMTHQEH